jgi:hypothetical protein
MRTKSNAGEASSKQDAKYRILIEEGWREFKELRKQVARDRAECARLRASSLGKMEETRELLRRVEASPLSGLAGFSF